MNAIARARELLLTPSATWDAIASERSSVQDVYLHYVAVLAAVPAIAYFVGFSFVGTGIPVGGQRVPFAHGVAHMVAFYVLTLGVVYALAVFVNALAPAFGGERDFTRAFRVAAYAPTAIWLAGVFYLLPVLSILALGGLYSLYLLHVGLPRLMSVPPERALPFTFGVVLAAIVLVVGVDVLAAMMIPARYRGF
jgi:Yip1-like protein